MSIKTELLDLMVKHPNSFTDKEFMMLVHLEGEEAVTFDDLRNNIRRIYDMNESSLLKESDAMKGSLAELNEKKQTKRRKLFFKRIRNGKRTPDYKTIVAEGDSWFCFPLYVTDINQWLIKDSRINLFSIASAGDWITNMIYEGKYIEELSMIKPDVFLLSGGGNDFVGSNRLAFMVDTNITNKNINDEHDVVACIADSFNAFVWTLKTQYWMILDSLHRAEKFKDMKIITQGYDYVIPYPKKMRSWDLIQFVINLGTATGSWLRGPLMLKGLLDAEKQRKIMTHFIDKVNTMFESLANSRYSSGPDKGKFRFPNLYHVDCRGVAGGFNGWFDEIHLKSSKFKIVAKAYKHIIFEEDGFDKNKKVVKAVNVATSKK